MKMQFPLCAALLLTASTLSATESPFFNTSWFTPSSF